jgi:RNase P subunit RPR2
MFECDNCQRWFHLKCQGTSKSEVLPGVLFFCRSCERQAALAPQRSVGASDAQ